MSESQKILQKVNELLESDELSSQFPLPGARKAARGILEEIDAYRGSYSAVVDIRLLGEGNKRFDSEELQGVPAFEAIADKIVLIRGELFEKFAHCGNVEQATLWLMSFITRTSQHYYKETVAQTGLNLTIYRNDDIDYKNPVAQRAWLIHDGETYPTYFTVHGQKVQPGWEIGSVVSPLDGPPKPIRDLERQLERGPVAVSTSFLSRLKSKATGPEYKYDIPTKVTLSIFNETLKNNNNFELYYSAFANAPTKGNKDNFMQILNTVLEDSKTYPKAVASLSISFAAVGADDLTLLASPSFRWVIDKGVLEPKDDPEMKDSPGWDLNLDVLEAILKH